MIDILVTDLDCISPEEWVILGILNVGFAVFLIGAGYIAKEYFKKEDKTT